MTHTTLGGRPRASLPRRLPWLLLWMFAAQAFVGVTVELLPIPLQAELAADLHVSPTEAGWTVSAFSASLAIFTIPLATVLRRVSPLRTLALGQVALFATTAASALAPTLPVLIAFRGLAGVSLGLIWSSVGAILIRLVPRDQLPRATSVSAAGVSAAFLLGLPAAAALGGQLGWQASFTVGGFAMLAVGSVAFVIARKSLRDILVAERRDPPPITVDAGSLRRVAYVGLLIVIVMAAQYASFTYVVAILPPGADPALFLVVFGASGVAGLFVVGLLARRSNQVLIGILVLLGAAVILAAVLAPWPVTAVCWGIAFGGVPPLLSARALAVAPSHLSGVASSVSSSAFQVGILLGSLGGGAALAAGGWHGPLYVSMGLVALGLTLTIVISATARIRPATGATSALRSGEELRETP